MADDGYESIDLGEMADRANVIFIGTLQDSRERIIHRKVEKADMACAYSPWKVEKLIKGQGKFKPGDEVMVFEPRQFMDFARAQKYKKTGLNYGIMVTHYSANPPADRPADGDRRIVFVYGDAPDYLILVAEGALESIDAEVQVQAFLNVKTAQ